jgi:hypothetical protein
MWSMAATALSWVLSLLGFGKKDERDIERAAGERLGRQEVQNEHAQAGIREVQTAIQARDTNAAGIASNPGRLHDGSDPAAGDYRPGPD